MAVHSSTGPTFKILEQASQYTYRLHADKTGEYVKLIIPSWWYLFGVSAECGGGYQSYSPPLPNFSAISYVLRTSTDISQNIYFMSKRSCGSNFKGPSIFTVLHAIHNSTLSTFVQSSMTDMFSLSSWKFGAKKLWKSLQLQFPDTQFLARKLGISPSLFVRQIGLTGSLVNRQGL